MKTPDEFHSISIGAHTARVQVRFADRQVADSRRALVLHETSYAPVFYLPRVDVDMSLLETSERTSHCPYKGDARYWSIRTAGAASDDAVWCYEEPYPTVAAIRGHLAFYPDRVDVIIVGA